MLTLAGRTNENTTFSPFPLSRKYDPSSPKKEPTVRGVEARVSTRIRDPASFGVLVRHTMSDGHDVPSPFTGGYPEGHRRQSSRFHGTRSPFSTVVPSPQLTFLFQKIPQEPP